MGVRGNNIKVDKRLSLPWPYINNCPAWVIKPRLKGFLDSGVKAELKLGFLN